jgi:hypothetical protein
MSGWGRRRLSRLLRGCSKRRCGRLLEGDSVNDRHTNPLACGKHVGGPLLFAASGGIEVRAPREFHGGEPVNDKHRGAAVGAVPVGGSLRGR